MVQFMIQSEIIKNLLIGTNIWDKEGLKSYNVIVHDSSEILFFMINLRSLTYLSLLPLLEEHRLPKSTLYLTL